MWAAPVLRSILQLEKFKNGPTKYKGRLSCLGKEGDTTQAAAWMDFESTGHIQRQRVGSRLQEAEKRKGLGVGGTG